MNYDILENVLQYLSIYDVVNISISNKTIYEICKFTKPYEIYDLSRFYVVDILAITSNWPNIKFKFKLNYSSITDQDLLNLSKIHTLDLTGCIDITDEGLSNLSKVHTLILKRCIQLRGLGLQHLSNVHIIDLNCCNQIKPHRFGYLSKIHTIDLSFCHQIKDLDLVYFKDVHSIYLYDCCNLSNSGISNIRGAKYMDLTRCIGVDGF